MKRKRIATSKTKIADLLNVMDGLRTGLNRHEARKALKFLETLETALIIRNYASVILIIRRNARKKADKLKGIKK